MSKMTIKELLKLTDMTHEQLSNYLDVPKRTIEAWSAGDREPTAYMMDLLEHELLPVIKQHMRADWSVYRSIGSPVVICGFDLIDAIDRNFDTIADMYRDQLGNVAGYRLKHVSAQYNKDILGGKGGCELIIISEPQPLPKDEDNPDWVPDKRTTTVWITCKESDLPHPHIFEITSNRRSFADIIDTPYSWQFGAALAILDALSHYTTIHCNEPAMYTVSKYASLLKINPKKAYEMAEKQVLDAKPRELPQLKKLWDTLAEIKQNLSGIKSVDGNYTLGYYQVKKILADGGYIY